MWTEFQAESYTTRVRNVPESTAQEDLQQPNAPTFGLSDLCIKQRALLWRAQIQDFPLQHSITAVWFRMQKQLVIVQKSRVMQKD